MTSFGENVKSSDWLQMQNKRASNLSIQGSNVGAAGQIRTADLILTNRLQSEKYTILCDFQYFYIQNDMLFDAHKSTVSVR